MLAVENNPLANELVIDEFAVRRMVVEAALIAANWHQREIVRNADKTLLYTRDYSEVRVVDCRSQHAVHSGRLGPGNSCDGQG